MGVLCKRLGHGGRSADVAFVVEDDADGLVGIVGDFEELKVFVADVAVPGLHLGFYPVQQVFPMFAAEKDGGVG